MLYNQNTSKFSDRLLSPAAIQGLRDPLTGIKTWSTKRLLQLFENYQRLNQTEGGIFSYADVLKELDRRTIDPANPLTAVQFIVENCRRRDDRLTDYPEVHRAAFYGGWRGQHANHRVKRLLEGANVICAANGIPFISVRVKPQELSRMNQDAEANFYRSCQNLGFPVPNSPARFVDQQLAETREFFNLG